MTIIAARPRLATAELADGVSRGICDQLVQALVAGLVTAHIGLRDASYGCGGFVGLLAIGTLAFERLSGGLERDTA